MTEESAHQREAPSCDSVYRIVVEGERLLVTVNFRFRYVGLAYADKPGAPTLLLVEEQLGEILPEWYGMNVRSLARHLFHHLRRLGDG